MDKGIKRRGKEYHIKRISYKKEYHIPLTVLAHSPIVSWRASTFIWRVACTSVQTLNFTAGFDGDEIIK